MNLPEAYKKVRSSVVAIAARTSTRPDFPSIIGTGVVVDPNGLVLTNDHVADAIFRLPRRKGAPATEWPAFVMFFEYIPNKGMATVPIDVIGVARISMDELPRDYYGKQPDLALLHIGTLKGIPHIEIAEQDLPVGSDVGILGFPMGTETLAAPGWLHQLTPTLQRGIISAQLPFECDAPHELMIDATTEGGSSGSPIFDPATAELVGLLYGGLNDNRQLTAANGDGSLLSYSVPTSHTLAISNFWIRKCMEKVREEPAMRDAEGVARKDFAEYLKTATAVMENPREGSSMLRRADVEEKKKPATD